ncbi:MAG: hypothetical protein FWC78_01345 [Defluviitaleaceae bacterium]|nr:hypothetical protein [Defluviitaleaceae bacterium]
MAQILTARDLIVKIFKQFEFIILPVAKFLLGLFVFTQINNIGHVGDAFLPIVEAFSPWMVNLFFAILFTIVPMNLSWIIIILSITFQFTANVEIAIAVCLFLLFVFLFYARMAPKESILILFTIMAFQFNIPYLVPILVGMYFPITAIIPVSVGVFVNAQIPVLFGLMAPGGAIAGMTDLDIGDIFTELPAAFTEIYTTLMSSIGATQTWLFTAIIFAMVIVLVHFLSRHSIDYAKEIAILLGSVINIFGFIMAVIVAGETISIGMVVLGSIICGVLAWVVRFFDGILDYQRAESVQFEDDNNFYHVKIVPKITMAKSQRVVKRIRPESENYDAPEA